MADNGPSPKEARAAARQARKEAREAKKAEKRRFLSFSDYPHLMKLKPLEKIVFHSDYFEIDDRVGTIMSFFHSEGAQDNFGPFWGINRIPAGMPDGVEIVLFEQNRRMTESWISSHQNTAESVSDMNQN